MKKSKARYHLMVTAFSVCVALVFSIPLLFIFWLLHYLKIEDLFLVGIGVAIILYLLFDLARDIYYSIWGDE